MANKAAWLKASKARPLSVEDAPMPSPGPNDIIIRNHAVALNPVDAAIQSQGIIVTQFPHILGLDVSGTVHAVGSAVTKFKLGDRVTALTSANSGLKPLQRGEGGFQLYSLVPDKAAAKIPESTTYNQGAVLPLAISTAATGLFANDTLGLAHPQINPKPNGKTVLVWGGSSSVGACAIQMLRAAGFDIATTCSARNFDFCKELGANHVFDYASESVVGDAVKALKGSDFAGAFDAVLFGNTPFLKAAQIVSQLDGRKFVSTVAPPGMPLPDGLPKNVEYGYSKLSIRYCVDSSC